MTLSNSRSPKRVFLAAGLAALILSGAADARPRILIDFAGDAGGVATTGDSWVTTSNATACGLNSTAPASCGVTFTSNSSVATKLGFQLNIGGVSYDSLFINKNGFITFGSARTGNFVAPATATIESVQLVITANGAVTRPFIAPLYRLMSIPDVSTSFAPFGGGASYFRATGDPLAPYNAAERVPAFAVTWIDSDFNLDPQVLTQLVLYSAGPSGDFYLRLRYGQSDNDQYSGLAGGSLVTGLATDAFQLASTLGGATANLNDYLFVFRNGALVPSIDSDADGLLNGVDNCRLVANADQRDSNSDGYGNPCDPDFNNNGIVDSQDGALLKAAFGSGAFPDRDLNGNNVVDSQDGAILKARFGQAPGPSGFKP